MAKHDLLESQVDSTTDHARQKGCAISAINTLQDPTKPMLTEAAATGFYELVARPAHF
jgi:hypothetical protein